MEDLGSYDYEKNGYSASEFYDVGRFLIFDTPNHNQFIEETLGKNLVFPDNLRVKTDVWFAKVSMRMVCCITNSRYSAKVTSYLGLLEEKCIVRVDAWKHKRTNKLMLDRSFHKSHGNVHSYPDKVSQTRRMCELTNVNYIAPSPFNWNPK